MLDLKFIKENPEFVKTALIYKDATAEIERILKLDDTRRKKQFEFETLRAEQNKISKEIGQLKKEKKDASTLLESMQKVAEQVRDLSFSVTQLEDEIHHVLLKIPNLPDKSVPIGKNAEDNIVYKEWGKIKNYTYKVKEHQDIAVDKGLIDFTRGAKVTGSGFPVYTNKGAILERALLNFMLDFHLHQNGYTEVRVPYLVNRASMTGTGQIPKLENDMYHVKEEDFFLLPTAEVPVTNLHSNEILNEEQLPIKYACYSPCFRKEAGSYGKDTKGLQRLHQFNKVEMVRFVLPEDSWTALEEMLLDAEKIIQALELPYRVLTLCTGDMSFASAKTYDIEVWSPATKKYLEVSSVSNFGDFQARRASIRYRDKERKVKFVHTLNGSGLATPRMYIAILENYQNEDGSITIPKVLLPYMHGIKEL